MAKYYKNFFGRINIGKYHECAYVHISTKISLVDLILTISSKNCQLLKFTPHQYFVLYSITGGATIHILIQQATLSQVPREDGRKLFSYRKASDGFNMMVFSSSNLFRFKQYDIIPECTDVPQCYLLSWLPSTDVQSNEVATFWIVSDNRKL